MKEVTYQFNSRGTYVTTDCTSFEKETQLRLIVQPHDFSLAIGGEVLRATSFEGCETVVSHCGEVVFYDLQGNVLGQADACERTFAQVRLEWKQGEVAVLFGCEQTVDYYPNCDGEHDRWGTEWVTQRTVVLDLEHHLVKEG